MPTPPMHSISPVATVAPASPRSTRRAARALTRVVGIALVAAVLTACSSTTASSGTASGETHTLTTAYGTVEAPVSPERVVAASYDTPWQLMSLGVKPIATQDYGKWIKEFTPEEQQFVKGLPTIGTFGEVNFEAIAKEKPDIIVGDADEIDQATYKRLSAIAPTIVAKGKSRGDWAAVTEQLAAAVGKTDSWTEAKATYTATLDRLKSQYAKQMSSNTWVHFSLGDDAGQFSIQQPTGSIGNLVVNELGLKYGPGVPVEQDDSGYGSYPLEQLGTVFSSVTVAVHPLNADGSVPPAIQAILDNELFTRTEVAQSHHVYGMRTIITSYVTANEWLKEFEGTVLEHL
ncbi:ABC transporter substrate-binding protein [Plantibacter sp. Mn2098]|uniref:ABC transporter substrate-binding protein n=1 Tax=Plantibacter sp. Mn2098 TaxID=3395266 RepID=UPI003BE0E7AA